MNNLSCLFACKKARNGANSHSNCIDNQLSEENKRQLMTSSIVILGRNTLIAQEDAKLVFRNSDQLKRGIISPKMILALQQPNRILRDDFLPSNEDILHIKCGSCGVEEKIISRNGSYFRFIRVAMKRSSINKWVQFFEDVDAIIFITSLLDYDYYIDSDSKKVRLRDDMDYFAAICNSKWFTKCSTVFLILNKFDLFQQKLAITSLKTCFPDYKGTDNATEAAKFIQQRFEALNRCKTKRVYTQIMSIQSDVEAIHQLVDEVVQLTAKPSSQPM
ncbi:Guanine nucleotide-binding protein G i subunit alpha [Taenia crassiceps]|uniref:Guanine nucleotide-binding protein G i subunit alpha n=1 Tax=Taenia crassiceps TaxID=6207 RepID=A0ABR4QFI2_9CEST